MSQDLDSVIRDLTQAYARQVRAHQPTSCLQMSCAQCTILGVVDDLTRALSDQRPLTLDGRSPYVALREGSR